MKQEFDEDVTQASMVGNGPISIFGTNNSKAKKRQQNWYEELFNLTEDINEYKRSYNLEDAEINPIRFKRQVKAFIRKEMNSIDISKYYQFDMTIDQVEEHLIKIQIAICNRHMSRDKDEVYVYEGYNQEELNEVRDSYVATIVKHFKEIGIEIYQLSNLEHDAGENLIFAIADITFRLT